MIQVSDDEDDGPIVEKIDWDKMKADDESDDDVSARDCMSV
jgi:hypothetical protein